MSILFDKTMMMLQTGLGVRRHQQAVTSSNIANADTPGYRARKADFSAALDRAQDRMGSHGIERTNARHLRGDSASAQPLAAGSILSEDTGLQPDVRLSEAPVRQDGNNVDLEHEMSFLAANGAEYQALATITRKKFGLMKYAVDKS
jgi:flagellar basal-body rod protein FlgB